MIKPEWKEIDGEKWFKFNSNYDKIRYFYGNILTIILILTMIGTAIFIFWYIGTNLDLIKSNPCNLCEQIGYSCMRIKI